MRAASLLGLSLATACARPGASATEPKIRVRSAPAVVTGPAAAAPVAPVAEPDRGTVPPTPPPAEASAIVSEVSPARLRATVDRLAAFGTRHTLSPAGKDRGIAAARAWIEAELRAAGGNLQVGLDPHVVAPDGRRIDTKVDVVNVIAVLPGAMPEAASRRYYVIGHYDSRNSDPMDRTGDAPGANDDGSGTALVIELARVMASRRFDATLVFMTTAGEEQGLVGARRHATAAKKAGLDVRAVLSNDIVGDPTGPGGTKNDTEVRVFSEGLPLARSEAELAALRNLGAEWDSPSRQLARYVDFVARWHDLPVRPALRYRPDRYLRGGDHTAFNEQGFAAVRFTEMAERYDRQHQDVRTEAGHAWGDVPEHVDEHYLAGVARLDAATLAHLANAPSAPGDVRLVVADLAVDTTVRWAASPEPDVAGYEVVWRATTAATWQHAKDAGKAQELVLPLSKDDWHFGVRAYDEAGYRSPVAFAGPGQR